MALVVQTLSKTLIWYVGSEPISKGYEIHQVTADGQELDYIKAHFENLPMCATDMVIWRNGFAQFIIDGIYQRGGK